MVLPKLLFIISTFLDYSFPRVFPVSQYTMAAGPSIDCTFKDNIKPIKPSLNSPHDVIEHHGRYIIADLHGHRVVSINPGDNSSTDLCKGKPDPHTTKHSIEPYSVIAFSDKDCDFLFTDQKNRCVLQVTDSGCRKWNAAMPLQDRFEHPTGLAMNYSSREVFVADCKKHCIYVFDLSGNFLRIFGTGALKFPWFIAVNSKEQLHVCDEGKVKIFGKSDDRSGSIYKLINTIDVQTDNEKWKCRGIDIDQYDNIFVTVRSASSSIRHGLMSYEKITIYDHIHQPVVNFGGRSQFNFIRGICIDYERNFIVVVDGEAHRLQRYKLYNDTERLLQPTTGASFDDFDIDNEVVDFGVANARLNVKDLSLGAGSFDAGDGLEFDDSDISPSKKEFYHIAQGK